MSLAFNGFLAIAAALNAVAALLHVGCIVFGAPWYRFFGAGEKMARMAEAGSWRPALVTAVIAVVLATWSLYAAAGAGLVPSPPLLRIGLCLITAAYLLRGLAGLALAGMRGSRADAMFWWWSSAICLGLGLVHALGLAQQWEWP